MLRKECLVRIVFNGKNNDKLTALAKKKNQTRTEYISNIINRHLNRLRFPYGSRKVKK